MNGDYKGRTLHLVGILDNCFMFMADLVRSLRIVVICHFLRVGMQDGLLGNVPVREIVYTPQVDLSGKHVVLLDAILQSGITLDYLCRCILAQNPSSLRTATLIERTDERKVDVATDYVGFRSMGKYLVGYGLGYQGQYRNLPCIAALA